MELDVVPVPAAPAPSGVRIERLDVGRFDEIRALNRAVFASDHVIQRLDRPDLLLLLADVAGEPVGFKAGYGESAATFYSAKGGVAAGWRRRGVARALLVRMEREARAMGYERLAFDTFPNKHPGMTVFGLAERFEVTAAGYNAAYRDYRLRFERDL